MDGVSKLFRNVPIGTAVISSARGLQLPFGKCFASVFLFLRG
jgi:hypothetical protein